MTISAPVSPGNTFRWIPKWLSGPWGWMAILATLYGFMYTLWTFFHWGSEERLLFIADAGYLPLSFLAALVCFRIWLDKSLDHSTRLAWGWIGGGLLANFCGDLLWFQYEVILETSPFPSWANAGYLGFYPLIMIGLLSFPYSPISRADQQRLYIDVFIILVASWMGIWYFILGPSAVDLSFNLESLLLVLYPMIDLAIIYGLVVFIFRHPDTSLRSGFGFVLIGMILFVIADVIYGVQSLNETYQSGNPLDSVRLLSYLFFIYAGLAQYTSLKVHGSHFRVARQVRYLWLLPYPMLALGYALLVSVLVSAAEINTQVRGLFAGALSLTALAVLRQVLDLNENRRLNAELRLRLQQLEETGSALNRAQHLASLGTLAAGVAHEINNPMGVIVASTGMLQRRIKEDQWNKETFVNNLGRIERSAWHVAKIAKSLLTYARGGELSLTRAAPRALIDDALQLIHLTPGSGLDLQVHVASDAPQVICDYDKVVQALVNLIDNARDALDEAAQNNAGPRTLSITADRNSNNELLIKVADTGTGMDARRLARAFDPFYTTKPIGQGTGLGLSICRGIVEAHDGKLLIDSEPGKGTTVTILLPLEPLPMIGDSAK